MFVTPNYVGLVTPPGPLDILFNQISFIRTVMNAYDILPEGLSNHVKLTIAVVLKDELHQRLYPIFLSERHCLVTINNIALLYT